MSPVGPCFCICMSLSTLRIGSLPADKEASSSFSSAERRSYHLLKCPLSSQLYLDRSFLFPNAR